MTTPALDNADCTGDEVLDIEGAAALLKVTPRTLRKLARAGVIPGRRLGHWRFSKRALLAYLSAGAPMQQDPPKRAKLPALRLSLAPPRAPSISLSARPANAATVLPIRRGSPVWARRQVARDGD